MPSHATPTARPSTVREDSAARAAIVELGASLFQRTLTFGRSGNLSVRTAEDRVLVTPTGVSLGALNADGLSVIDLQGRHLERGRHDTGRAGADGNACGARELVAHDGGLPRHAAGRLPGPALPKAERRPS